jgi:hypothetical protein
VLETVDGGKKWNYGAIPVDGELAQLRISKRIRGDADPVLGSQVSSGSAVFKTPLGSPDGRVIFGERDRAATDIALLERRRRGAGGHGTARKFNPGSHSRQAEDIRKATI